MVSIKDLYIISFFSQLYFVTNFVTIKLNPVIPVMILFLDYVFVRHACFYLCIPLYLYIE